MKLAAALLLTSVLIKCTLCAIGETNLYQYEEGPFIPDNSQISYPALNPLLYQITPSVPEVLQGYPERRNARQLQHLPPSPPKVPMDTSQVTKSLNSGINEVIEALNKMAESEDHQDSRAAERGNDYGFPHPLSYDYPVNPVNYGPWTPAYEPHPYKHEHSSSSKLSLLKPDLLVKPVAAKAASKISGLVELGLALFSGSASGDLELKGLKDIVINGIVKPLLLARGGLKALISKLSIPLISLLLINLEVLITIWWLWEEDCPKPVYHAPVYSHPTKPVYQAPSYPPPSYNYNSYR